jgi:hypothetical protein
MKRGRERRRRHGGWNFWYSAGSVAACKCLLVSDTLRRSSCERSDAIMSRSSVLSCANDIEVEGYETYCILRVLRGKRRMCAGRSRGCMR